MGGIDFRIDVPIHRKDVEAAIVINIHKHRPPSQKAGVEAQACFRDRGGKCSISIVAIKGRGVVREVGFENIRAAVVVVVADGRTHTGLLTAIFIESNAHFGSDVNESSIFQVVIKNAWRTVASDIDIRPAIVIVVQSGDAQAVVRVSFLDSTRLAYVLKLSVSEIVIKNIWRGRKSARSAHHRRALPQTSQSFAGLRRSLDIEKHIVGDHEIELSIAIVINERATGAPCLAIASDSRRGSNFLEGPVTLVVVKTVLAVISHVKIVEAIVGIVSDAGALSPTCELKTGGASHIGERSIMIVVKQVAGGRLAFAFFPIQSSAIHQEYVGPAVVVVIQNC